MAYRKLSTATRRGQRLDQLKTLATALARTIDEARLDPDQVKQLAPLAKQYRDTIREIEQIEGTGNTDDEISAILQDRADDGKPGAVRPDRSRLSNK